MEIKYGIEEPDHTLIITVDWDTQSDVAKKKKSKNGIPPLSPTCLSQNAHLSMARF